MAFTSLQIASWDALLCTQQWIESEPILPTTSLLCAGTDWEKSLFSGKICYPQLALRVSKCFEHLLSFVFSKNMRNLLHICSKNLSLPLFSIPEVQALPLLFADVSSKQSTSSSPPPPPATTAAAAAAPVWPAITLPHAATTATPRQQHLPPHIFLVAPPSAKPRCCRSHKSKSSGTLLFLRSLTSQQQQ